MKRPPDWLALLALAVCCVLVVGVSGWLVLAVITRLLLAPFLFLLALLYAQP